MFSKWPHKGKIEAFDGTAPEEIARVELGPRGAALHWETLDGDVSLEGLLVRTFSAHVGQRKRAKNPARRLSHPVMLPRRRRDSNGPRKRHHYISEDSKMVHKRA